MVCIACAALLVACSSGPRRPAPVEDRTSVPGPARAPAQAAKPATAPPASSASSGTSSAPAASTAPVSGGAAPAATATPGTVSPLPPGSENAGKPGYYTVKQGDTLIRIALDHGQNLRDIVRWNQLDNPNRIEVGQVLRVVPPGAAEGAAAAASPPAPAQGAAAGATGSAGTAPGASGSAAASNRPAAAADEDLGWIWPASGQVLAGFDEVRNKGLDLVGNAGDPVLAAAEGRVVYAGSGLRGYGNLVIIKHNNTFLSAYAHNQTLLVKEDQLVRKGQKIAEMGNSDADRVKLHFEIRRQGKPVDPARYLPAR
ncbi:MAG: LysM peptidoglycan-binding domain-containing protein [Betaproteobacteria bacterium]|nr:LysM peptidoglycan-binding domain-containing protein [Betaproteobacteria bacterium]